MQDQPDQPLPLRTAYGRNHRASSGPVPSCKATGAQKFTLNTTTPLFIGSYRFQPLDPIQPGDPIRPDACRTLGGLSVDFRLNANDQGIVTGATAVALDPE
ncbi:hypothetical protein [Pseudarthrobacter sulfonivorans]|uniref:hypothetical protein n=1 Tax=Pseudarthrobacter sulfonivorans TaxID=121292 RepID=UPI00168C0924|nr:hypothetical protein [Pseudarthrobacter sulfonivorans]